MCGEHLTCLLRPEFVKNYPTALCPDAYSRFCPDASFRADIDAATQLLKGELIPRVAQQLPLLLSEQIRERGMDDLRLVEALHRHGINIRHLGHVFACLKLLASTHDDIIALRVILVEMFARVIKNELRQKLRERMKGMRTKAVMIRRMLTCCCVAKHSDFRWRIRTGNC